MTTPTPDDQALAAIANALTEHWDEKHSTPLTAHPCSGCTRAVLPVVKTAQRDAWADAYECGVQDEITSQDFDGGRTRPARRNPYEES